MKKTLYFILLAVALTIGACAGDKNNIPAEGRATQDLILKGDKTVFGLACEGCNDSVICLLPFDNSDPIKYDIIDAKRNGKVIGDLRIGDWIGILPNKDDSKVADLVINLDQLRGSWCYIVMPKFRDWDKLTKKQQARMSRNMTGSIREQYLIPREYGFTLMRQFQASSIGYVPDATSLEDQSPVVYPKMAYYFEWHILNGQLILTRYASDPPSDTDASGKKIKVKMPETIHDTIDVTFLNDDSLVLSSDGQTRSYYRISKASDANKLAREKAEKSAREALKKVTRTENSKYETNSEKRVAEAHKSVK